ncbi:MAG: alpha/beta fold hydrolase [Brevundimonas sp.]|uniref:alpha/beta fold hydrolase n=1 Tax=Brevundimonas sp. TaxID=1871086 RepID=UPI0028D14DC8|nr:alpha/beta fold hydrolase [uncultured Brevundimonas sp.]
MTPIAQDAAAQPQDRRRLVLIPGLLNDADLWRDQVAALSGRFDVHVADITGPGDLDDLAREVLALGGDGFAVAGFSLGGFVAQAAVRLAPERIARLALLDTSIRADSADRAQQRRRLEAVARTAGAFHGFGERLAQTYLSARNAGDAATIDRVRRMTARLGAEVFLRQNALDRPDGEAVLRGFDGPVLILCGAEDQITPLDGHREMATLARDARLVVVENAGHLTPIEAPEAVTAALIDWMDAD